MGYDCEADESYARIIMSCQADAYLLTTEYTEFYGAY